MSKNRADPKPLLDLRHTYASLLIQSGQSLAYVRDQLGHHSIKVTVDIYGHLAPEGNKGNVGVKSLILTQLLLILAS